VSDHLDDEVIARLLSAGSRETAAAALVNDALRAGSRDNVSAVVADVVARTDVDVGWLDALQAPGSPSQ
jgi:serine/threonine protein phosphatase PrpC